MAPLAARLTPHPAEPLAAGGLRKDQGTVRDRAQNPRLAKDFPRGVRYRRRPGHDDPGSSEDTMGGKWIPPSQEAIQNVEKWDAPPAPSRRLSRSDAHS